MPNGHGFAQGSVEGRVAVEFFDAAEEVRQAARCDSHAAIAWAHHTPRLPPPEPCAEGGRREVLAVPPLHLSCITPRLSL
eukprot:5763727-Prymnesium_polylepis.1